MLKKILSFPSQQNLNQLREIRLFQFCQRRDRISKKKRIKKKIVLHSHEKRKLSLYGKELLAKKKINSQFN